MLHRSLFLPEPRAPEAGPPRSPVHPSFRRVYDIGTVKGRWYAIRLRGGPLLEAATEEELASLIVADWAAR